MARTPNRLLWAVCCGVVLTKSSFGVGADGPGLRDMLGEELTAYRARQAEADLDVTEGDQAEYAQLVPEPKVGHLDLEQFPYQLEPFYSDEVALAEEVVYMKATQVGASTALWRWILRRADQFGETGIYYFPTDKHVTDFGDERITPAVEASEYLQQRLTGVNQKHMKQFGAGTLYLRGVNSQTAVQSVAADAMVFDEYDESDQKNLAQAERRLSGARAAGRTPRVRRMGRPSLPGYGIAAAFEGTDKRKWMVTCGECGLEQELTFEDNLRWQSEAGGDDILRAGADNYEQDRDVTRAWRACKGCEASLEAAPGERGPIYTGTWKRTKEGPGRIPGYHVTRLIVPRTDLLAIVVGSRNTKPHEIEIFHWADLGMPYAAADAALTDMIIERACAAGELPRDEYRGRFPVTMGVDSASERALSVVISEHGPDDRRRALYIAEVQDDPGRGGQTAQQKLEDLMRRFRVQVAVIDSEPERRMARGLAKKFPGRVFLCNYQDNAQDAIRFDPERRMVTVDRTEAIDAMMDGLRELKFLPLRVPPPKFVEQLKSPKRRIEEDTKGRPRRVYIKTGTRGDDYAHACVYDLVADELLWMLGLARAQARTSEVPLDAEEDIGVPAPGLFEYDAGFGG